MNSSSTADLLLVGFQSINVRSSGFMKYVLKRYNVRNCSPKVREVAVKSKQVSAREGFVC